MGGIRASGDANARVDPGSQKVEHPPCSPRVASLGRCRRSSQPGDARRAGGSLDTSGCHRPGAGARRRRGVRWRTRAAKRRERRGGRRRRRRLSRRRSSPRRTAPFLDAPADRLRSGAARLDAPEILARGQGRLRTVVPTAVRDRPGVGLCDLGVLDIGKVSLDVAHAADADDDRTGRARLDPDGGKSSPLLPPLIGVRLINRGAQKRAATTRLPDKGGSLSTITRSAESEAAASTSTARQQIDELRNCPCSRERARRRKPRSGECPGRRWRRGSRWRGQSQTDPPARRRRRRRGR